MIDTIAFFVLGFSAGAILIAVLFRGSDFVCWVTVRLRMPLWLARLFCPQRVEIPTMSVDEIHEVTDAQ